jgi:hypothetical protein
MGLVREQNIKNDMGVTINPTAQFQPDAHLRSFKMVNALNVVLPTSLFRKRVLCCHFEQLIGPLILPQHLTRDI